MTEVSLADQLRSADPADPADVEEPLVAAAPRGAHHAGTAGGRPGVARPQHDGRDGEQDDGGADDRLGRHQARAAAAAGGGGLTAAAAAAAVGGGLADVSAVGQRGESIAAAGAAVVGEGLARFGGGVEEVPDTTSNFNLKL